MISIRRIHRGEGDLLRTVRLAALKDSPHAFGSTYASALERSTESWHEQADASSAGRDRATCFAISETNVVGMAALYRDRERAHVGEILQVWVVPEHRGQGVADALMDALLQWAGENGFRSVLATVTAGNARALAFYQRIGFRLSDEAPRCKPGDPVLVKEIG